jgi:hypothetical protein
MDTYFDVPDEVAQQINQGMDLGGKIELPFTAPFVYWKNGSPTLRAMAQTAPALYYGGWEVDRQGLDDAIEEYGPINGVPFVPVDLTSKNGKEYMAYLTRYLYIAPISFREFWELGSQETGYTRVAKYQDGARHKVQLLAMLGQSDANKNIVPWGAIVLSAGGYQAGYLKECVRNWRNALEKPRKQHAPKVPVWAFWMCIGTFGTELKVENVGKNAKSPITPIKVATPQTIDLELMKKLYVGSGGLTLMSDWLTSAREWLDAGKQPSQPTPQGQAGGGGEEEEHEFPPIENDIPF